MNEFVQKLLEMTLYGSIAIVLVLVFRLLFRKVSKKVTCIFWIVVAVRLLCPVNFNMGFSAGDLIPGISGAVDSAVGEIVEVTDASVTQKTVVADAAVAHDIAGVNTGVNAGGNADTVEGIPAVAEVQSKARGPLLSSSTLAFLIWAGVAMLLFAVLLKQNGRTRKIIKEGIERGRMYRSKSNGVHPPMKNLVLISEKVRTPFVVGILSPIIVLPAVVDASEKEYLLCHEKVHIKNKDNLTRALGLFIVCIHWFNPLVWIAYKCFCNDLEMRVDEEVIDRIGTSIKKDYCLSIVNHAMSGARYKVSGASFAKRTLSGMEVKMRIKNLIRYKKDSKLVAVLVSVIALGGTMVLSSCAHAKAAAGKSDESTTLQERIASSEVTETTTAASETTAETSETTAATTVETTVAESTDADEMFYIQYDETIDPSALNIIFNGVHVEARITNKENIYYKDLDNDGEDELISNFQYSGDGARRVYIYRTNNDSVEIGYFETNLCNAEHYEEYDPERGLIIHHKEADNSEVILTMDDFEFVTYVPGEDIPG
ncbi:MAG: hypothetical protein IKG93_13500 [Clostridiales bacterium]|nr:hypothetical protein [Clostridiales bacterium]